jgi:glycosyltransferase involved in cell wall biosynthesis
MRVGINGRFLEKESPTGISKYTFALLSELSNLADINQVLVFGAGELPETIPSDGCTAIEENPEHSGVLAHAWDQCVVPVLAHRHDVDLLHSPAGVPPLVCPVPAVMTIHDLSPVRHPEWFTTQYATFYRLMTPLALRNSDAVITVSEFTQREVQAEYPHVAERIEVVYNGTTPPPTGTAAERAPEEYFLSVGALNERKNLERLLEAYQLYRGSEPDPPDLVVVGPDREIFAETKLPEVAGVTMLGYVSDETLGWLYRNATALLYPSLYEGFGFPIVEAMSVGTPVVTSNRGAMKEVAGSAGVLVDPENATSIAEGMRRSTEQREDLVREGLDRASAFTWKRTATQTLDIYRQVLE